MYVEVTIVENNKEYKHLEYFPKFDKINSLNHLQEVYRERLKSYKLIGNSLAGYKGIK